MNCAYKYYSDDIISWDLVLKNPYNNLFFYRDIIKGCFLYTNVAVNNENDFKIVKVVEFFNKLLDNDRGGVLLKRSYSTGNKKFNTAKRILFSALVRKFYLLNFLETLSIVIFNNISKKRIPIQFGLDPLNGIFMLQFKDIGELGLSDLNYDYFAWQNNFTISLRLNTNEVYFMNLIISYLNFKLRK